jgi:DNA primase catalytic subunit
MLDLSTVLKYYKRKEIQEAIVKAAENREVAVSFGGKGYGKRPDTLRYPSDVIEFAKQRATSFHCSEERWGNPLQVQTGMRKQELDKLRIGWDLVLDIDCPDWTISKIIAWLIIKSLKDHGIKSISAKFSGNKGFHIGVPFEAMPESIRNKQTSSFFPDGPRKIAAYLMHYIGKNYTKVDDSTVIFGNKIRIPISKIKESTGKKHEEITERLCSDCKKKIETASGSSVQFVCSRCESQEEGKKEDAIKKCPKCSSIMEKIEARKSICSCGSNSYVEIFSPESIVEVDTILIASRHLYRMPYSLHEKSGLASIPIDPERIMEFEKEQAKPEKVVPGNIVFLDSSKSQKDEAEKILITSLHFSDAIPSGNETGNGNKAKNIEEIKLNSPLPKELFPPCIKNILKGIEDGKKRSVFVLLNFLTNLGWGYEDIEALLKEWNSKNPEPLREVVMLGQLRYHKQNKKRVLPPNCDNKGYYKDYGICKPDNLCARIKNPVSYGLRKARFLNKENNKASTE